MSLTITQHKAVIAKLRRYGRWLVDGSANHIEMSRRVGKQACTVRLDRSEEGYSIQPVTYSFRSASSHFDYVLQEERWARNKHAFRSLIKTLKQCGVWGLVANKNFIHINDNNKQSKKGKVKDELMDLLRK